MKGFKTVLFGLVVALLPLLDYINGSDIFSTFMSDPAKQHWATFAVGAMIIILRSVTNTPMFQQSGMKVDETLSPQPSTPSVTDTPVVPTPSVVETANNPVTPTPTQTPVETPDLTNKGA